MTTSDDFRLTVHFFPRAAEAGVRPQPYEGFSFDNSPTLYRPHEIDFSFPPSREDFIAVTRQTPWMHVWQTDLMPVIAGNQWPIVAPGYKAASVNLIDAAGRCVGRLDVSRNRRFCNTPYSVPFFGTYSGSEVDQMLKRRVRDKARREQAKEHVEKNRHLILERVASGDGSTEAMLAEVKRVLIDGSYIKQRHAVPA